MPKIITKEILQELGEDLRPLQVEIAGNLVDALEYVTPTLFAIAAHIEQKDEDKKGAKMLREFATKFSEYEAGLINGEK